jgi:hypothetical protein
LKPSPISSANGHESKRDDEIRVPDLIETLVRRTDSTIAAPMTATPDTATARPSFADTLAVYLKPRVLIVLFLGFSAGLPVSGPLALSRGLKIPRLEALR